MTTVDDTSTEAADDEKSRVLDFVSLAAWVLLVGLALWWGERDIVGKSGVHVNAAPLFGRWRWHGNWWLLAPAAFGGVVVAWGPRLARSLSWRWLPIVAGVAAIAWALLLAVTAGWDALTEPLTNYHEYEPFANEVTDLGQFWRTFTSQAAEYPTHVRGHPPGATAIPILLDRVGLGGPGWLAVLVIVFWGMAVGSAVWAQRWVAGEAAARRAVPALVVLPAAIWAATSMDSLFTGVLAVGLALVACSSCLQGRRLRLVAAGGGAVLGLSLLLTYGAVPLIGITGLLLAWRRRFDVLVPVVIAAAGVLGLSALLGFWWLEGLLTTRELYWEGIASIRDGWYFTLAGNPAALALATGPGLAVGLGLIARSYWQSPRPRRLARQAVLPVAGLVAVVGANLSQMSRAEVERIWLLFVPWLALAIPGNRRLWLGLSVLTALVLEGWLRTPW